MQEQFNYFAGPYKGYCGRGEYDSEAGVFHGEVVGTQDVVTFQGTTFSELGKAFRDSVDDYIAFCNESGQPPEKPFSGKFIARIPPELHRALSAMALSAGKSLNQFLCDALESIVKNGAAAGTVCDLKPK